MRLHQLQYPSHREFPEKTLDSAISDMTKVLLPDLTVIDGYIGLEGLGPSAGQSIRSDFAVASFNPLAADKTCCALMGFAFKDVVHLRLVRDRKIVSLNGVRIVPGDFMRFARPFKPAPEKLEFEFPNIVVHEKSACSACLSTTLLFLKRFACELGDYVLKDGKIHLAIGKDADGMPPGTILIGNCTSKHKAKGKLVLGCPPVASRIFKAITGVEPATNEPEPQ